MAGMAQRKSPTRAIRLVRPPSLDGVGVFSVRVGAESSFYTLREIPCQIGGRGFAVHRLGLGVLYHVRVGAPEDCSCDCPGFTYRGRCKHVLGLLALVNRGQL
jgi:SWIM zinc finger